MFQGKQGITGHTTAYAHCFTKEKNVNVRTSMTSRSQLYISKTLLVTLTKAGFRNNPHYAAE